MVNKPVDWLRCALPLHPKEDSHYDRPFVQKHIIAALKVAIAEPQYATPNLSKYFRETRALGSKDRRRVQNAVYGLIRHQHLIMRAGLWEEEQWPVVWREICSGYRFEELSESTPQEDYATALSLPIKLSEALRSSRDIQDALALAQNLNIPPPIYLRAQKIDREALQSQLKKDGVVTYIDIRAPHALRLEGRANLQANKLFQKGCFEIQDISSQMLSAYVAKLAKEQRSTVIDFCAGAGGKALALAAEGIEVYAQEPRSNARRELSKRAKRAGFKIRFDLPKKAGVVLVDAPCSGSGRLHRDPTLRWRLQPNHYTNTQKNILAQAREYVESNGSLIYATCSLFDLENDQVIKDYTCTKKQSYDPKSQDGFFWAHLSP